MPPVTGCRCQGHMQLIEQQRVNAPVSSSLAPTADAALRFNATDLEQKVNT